MARLFFVSLLVFAGCGDDGGVMTSDAARDAAGDSAFVTDVPNDAGVGGLRVTVVSGPFGALTVVENAKVWLDTPDGLRELSTDRGGEVFFDGVDLDEGGLVLTTAHPQHIATTYAGFDREVIRFHEDRGWPVSADEGRMVVALDRVATVALSGTVSNVPPGLSTLFVEPLDGDALQFRGFLALPWTIRISPQTSATLIGWAWSLEPAGFGDRGRSWLTDATFLETPAAGDTGDLVLDFSTDVPLTTRNIAFVVPTGSRFFETALPLASLSTVTPRGQIGAIVGFPMETTYDDATRVVTASLGVVDPPAGEASFLTLSLEGEGSGQSSVVLDWDGPPSAPIAASFLSPPTLAETTADGISLGQRVAWGSSETDTIHYVTYAVDTAPRWYLSYWGEARLRAEFPSLDPIDVEEILLTEGTLTGNVTVCEFTPALCRRVASSRAFDVSR